MNFWIGSATFLWYRKMETAIIPFRYFFSILICSFNVKGHSSDYLSMSFFPHCQCSWFSVSILWKTTKKNESVTGKKNPKQPDIKKNQILYYSKNNKNKTSFKFISGTCFSANTNIIPVFSFSVQVIFQSQILFSIPKFDVTVWALYKRRIDEPRHMGTNIFIL